MKRALIYTIIFAAIQFLTGGVATLAFELLNGDSKSATGLIVSTATASIIAVIIFLTARWTVVSRHWIQTRPWFVLFWCVMGALGILVPFEPRTI